MLAKTAYERSFLVPQTAPPSRSNQALAGLYSGEGSRPVAPNYQRSRGERGHCSMRSHRRTFSMNQVPTGGYRSSGPQRSNQEVMHELRTRADELESLFAARRPGSSGCRMSSVGGVRLGDARVDSADEVFDEMPMESSGEPTSGLVEFDGDLLLNMVDNLQHNMKQSLSGSSKGRLYEQYLQMRDAKLRRERGSAKWVRKKEVMMEMEDGLEKISAEIKVRFGDSADRKDSVLLGHHSLRKKRSFSVRSAIEFREQHDMEYLDEQAQYDQHKSLGTVGTRKILSSKSISSSTSRNLTGLVPRSSRTAHSTFTKQRIQSVYPSAQMTRESPDLRKENMKPLARLGNVPTHSDWRTFDRSKSTAAGIDSYKEERQPRIHHTRNSSVSFGELKELIPRSSDSSSLALSSFPREKNQNTASKKIQISGEPKTFLRRGGGIGPGAGASIAKSRASKIPESQSNGEDDEKLVNQQEYSADMVRNTDEEFGRTNELGSSGDHEYVAQDDGSSAFTPNFDESCSNVDEVPGERDLHIHPSISSVHEASDIDGSVDSPRGNSDTRNTHHLNLMPEADAARVRKKWGGVERLVFATNESDQPLKDIKKVFKKLLRFGSKSKNAEKRLNDSISTSTASEGGDDTEDGSKMGRQSASVVLHEGRIFHEQAPRSLVSFPRFNSRGAEVKA
ncbi:unnamed protein product [Musa acuminata subsp. burmannicoides]